jgi:hypothetical protein
MSQTPAEKTVSNLLRKTKIEVTPAVYVLVGLRHHDWTRLLQESELSPSADAQFMIFRDNKEVTLLVEEDDWQRMRHAVRDARVEGNFRLVTLDIELLWNVVGYFAQVSEILAAAGVSIGALSSFSRDHLLIKQEDLGKALRALGDHVGELC